MLAALPPGQPGTGQLFDALEPARHAVQLDVMIDVDTVDESSSCFAALSVLLSTHGIRTWRYSDHGPPDDVQRSTVHQGVRPGDGAEPAGSQWKGFPLGWVEVLAVPGNDAEYGGPTVTHVTRSSDGRTEHESYIWGYRYPADADIEVEFDFDAFLLGRAAASAGMGLVVSERTALTDPEDGRWHDGAVVLTCSEAVATVGLVLRNAGQFQTGPYRTTSRGTYLWLALDSLLPNYGLWAAACSADGVAGPGRIYYLSTATEGRLFQVLNARDQVAVAMSRRDVDWVDVADALDRFLVFLLAAMDATAGVVREVACSADVAPKDAKWQFARSFLKPLRSTAPQLAGMFDPGMPAADLHVTLRELRNTIHGGGLTRTHGRTDTNDLEHRISVPLDEVDGLLGAVARQTSGDTTRWGLHLTDDRLWIQPAPLVDALTIEGFAALDAIFEHTPLASLLALSATLNETDDETFEQNDDGEDNLDPVERSNRRILQGMLDTRGTEMYLWHLGLHPEQRP